MSLPRSWRTIAQQQLFLESLAEDLHISHVCKRFHLLRLWSWLVHGLVQGHPARSGAKGRRGTVQIPPFPSKCPSTNLPATPLGAFQVSARAPPPWFLAPGGPYHASPSQCRNQTEHTTCALY